MGGKSLNTSYRSSELLTGGLQEGARFPLLGHTLYERSAPKMSFPRTSENRTMTVFMSIFTHFLLSDNPNIFMLISRKKI